jgi:hypothetical protein
MADESRREKSLPLGSSDDGIDGTLARRARPPGPAHLMTPPTRGRPAAGVAATMTLKLDGTRELLAALRGAAAEQPRECLELHPESKS